MSADLFSSGQGGAPVDGPDAGIDAGDALAGPVGPSAAVSLPTVVGASGRRTAFDDVRLRQSIERAQRESGEASSTLADEVADIVRFTLASRTARALDGDGGAGAAGPAAIPLHVDELGALVERALIEVGAAGPARAYIVARDRKLRSRAAAGPGSSAGPRGPADRSFGASSTSAGAQGLPAVRGRGGAEPFQTRRIVAALIEEVEMLPAEAESVSEAVAGVLSASGLRVVSSALVRELVSSQLLALGHGEALKRHESVGLPRHDLTQLFRLASAESLEGPGGGDPVQANRRFEESAGQALMRRWALDGAIPGSLGEAHRRGDLFVAGLEALHRVRVRSMPAGLVVNRGGRGRSGAGQGSRGGSALSSLARWVRLAKDTGEALVIEDPAALVGDAAAIHQECIRDLALALGAAAEGSDRRIDLAWSVEDESRADRGLLAWVMAVRLGVLESAPVPRLFAPLAAVADVVRTGGADAGDAVELLLRTGSLVPAWAGAGSSWAGLERRARRSGSDEGAGDRTSAGARERGALAIGGTVALNLPRLARRAGPWREDVLLESLSGAMEFAVEALESIADYQARARSQHGVSVSDRVCHTVVPVGLLDALRILGDGIARADQGARVLGFLGEAAERLGASRGLDVRLDAACVSGSADRAATWFAACDARQSGPGQPRLFSDLPTPEVERPLAYRASPGSLVAHHDEARVRARAEALGSLFATVRAGALLPDLSEPGFSDVPAHRAAAAIDFQEVLARSPRVALDDAPFARGDRPQGPSGASAGDTTGPSPEEIELAAAVSFLGEGAARWPRLGAWARFTQVRGSGQRPLETGAETTLF